MALRHYRPEDHQYEEYVPQEQQATYQTYQKQDTGKERFREFLFFVNVALFSIITVLSSYVYLSFKLPTFLAFLLAIATGAVGLKLIQAGIRKQFKNASKTKK